MNSVFESITAGFTEAVEDTRSATHKLPRRTVTVILVKEYQANQIKKLRANVNMSQKAFAGNLDELEKTTES